MTAETAAPRLPVLRWGWMALLSLAFLMPFLFDRDGVWWLAGGAGALVGSVWNYTMGSVFTWRKRSR